MSDEARERHVRRTSETLIAAVLQATRGQPATDRLLALGAACPYSARRDREIWLEEIERQEAEGKENDDT